MAGHRTSKPKTAEADVPESLAAEAAAPLGDQLKAMFETVATSPMPERLTQLVDELEEKFRAGELRRDSTN